MSCQARSLVMESSIWGTAPEEMTQWVLVEYPNAWPAKFSDFSALHLPPKFVKALNAIKQRPQWKVLWIRRPGCKGTNVYWWNLQTEECMVAPQQGEWDGEWTEYADWVSTAATDLVAPKVLVCTHGSRDQCCGVLGGAAFAGLRKILPDAVWQVSHLGGHRFAPTALCFPFGWLLGRIEPDDWMDVALAAMSGIPNGIRCDIVRGDVRLNRRDQALQIWIREQCGTVESVSLESVHWRDANGILHTVQQSQRLLGELEVSCANTKTKPVFEWVFTEQS